MDKKKSVEKIIRNAGGVLYHGIENSGSSSGTSTITERA